MSALRDDECQAIFELTGQTVRNGSLLLNLDAFAEIVKRTERFDSLAHLLEAALGRGIENKRAIRLGEEADWQHFWEWSIGQAAENSGRQNWLAGLRRSGWLKNRSRGNLAIAQELLATALRLLDELPVSGVPLAVFAARHLNDAHGLDFDRDLGRLVCRAIAVTCDLALPRKRSDLRHIWESVGVVPDELSVTVLSLNLPVIGNSVTDQVLRAQAEAGEPCRLTFRQLRTQPPTMQRAEIQPLYVCENPSVVACAAERLGPRCPPLICVEGQPNFAAWKLLTIATAAGWQLAYHGDFDRGGIRIANRIYEQFSFRPWQFDAEVYRASKNRTRQLIHAVPAAAWDPTLAPAMNSAGQALEEEQVIDELIADLQAASVQSAAECGGLTPLWLRRD